MTKVMMGMGLALVALAGCAGQKVQLNPTDVASGLACYAQIQALTRTAQDQVSACVDLGRSVAAQASTK